MLRDYAWGSRTAIPDLLGISATDQPVAELWLGAHPDSPATIQTQDGESALDDWIGANAEAALGAASRARFGDRLPYLLKILAADRALSLQVHPSADQAEQGFAGEQAAGVAKDARERRYKDPFHKPEMMVALTPFHALCGLRPVQETLELLDALAIEHPTAQRLRDVLAEGPEPEGLRAAFEYLLGSQFDPTAVDAAVRAAHRYLSEHPDGPHALVAQTTMVLADTYPGDAGVVVSLLLNRLTLAPGEAIYMPAGNVHAYLQGTGIEVMATSDNVLRAGLTPKYVDAAELMRVVDFVAKKPPYLTPEHDGPATRFSPPVEEFATTVITPTDEQVTLDDPGPRILLALRGELTASDANRSRPLAVGEAIFLADAAGPLTVAGTGIAVLVSVPNR